jgi:PIN domain nuclease of toxin-antitoxin system
MKALLDSHAFLWALSGDTRMSTRARDIFEGPSSLSLSIVSIWEILIKVQLGKLGLPRSAASYIFSELVKNKIATLPIRLDHLIAYENLPLHHRDPFDRMLIAQGIKEELPIITADRNFQNYSVRTIW